MPCSNAAKTQNPLKLVGVPQTPKPISAVSGPKFTILSGHVEEVLLLNKFFPIVDTCLSCEDNGPTKLCDVAEMAIFCVLCFQRATCNTFQTCILNSHWGHTICGSMADIQSPTAEIRRGKKKKEEERKKETGWKYNGLPYYIGRHNNIQWFIQLLAGSSIWE